MSVTQRTRECDRAERVCTAVGKLRERETLVVEITTHHVQWFSGIAARLDALTSCWRRRRAFGHGATGHRGQGAVGAAMRAQGETVKVGGLQAVSDESDGWEEASSAGGFTSHSKYKIAAEDIGRFVRCGVTLMSPVSIE